jgi:hypothetical protein
MLSVINLWKAWMSSWSFKALREHVKSRNEESELDIERIKSIDRAIDIYRYHLHQAKTQNDLVQAGTPREQMKLIFPSEENREEIWQRKIAIQANTQACIHSARAIHDLFAQLINSLILDSKVPVFKCDINIVTKELQSSDLKEHLQALLDSHEFKYVNAFVNTIKHRNIVEFGSLISFETNECGVRFKGFKFNGSTYDQKWAEDVLKVTLEVKNTVVTAGCILNRQLGIVDL